MTCLKCGSAAYVTAPCGPHIKASCSDCGAFIKFVNQPASEFQVYIGKHKGKKLKDIPRDYVEWLAKNTDGRIAIKAKQFLTE